MTCKRFRNVCFSILAYAASCAACFAYDTTGYVTLTGKDTSTSGSSSFASSGLWSPSGAPEGARSYYVPKNTALRTTHDQHVDPGPFAGDVLAVAGELYMYTRAGASIPRLHMLEGGYATINNHIFYLKDSAITVYSETYPFAFYCNPNYDNGEGSKCVVTNCTFASGSSGKVKFNIHSKATAGYRFVNVDASAFLGTMLFTYDGTATGHVTHFNGFSCGGTVELVGNATISPVGSGGATISNIVVGAGGGVMLTADASIVAEDVTFADGATLSYPSASNIKPLVVNGSLTLAGTVNLPVVAVTTNDMSSVALVRVPAAKSIDATKFVLADDLAGMMTTGLTVEEADGWKTLTAHYRKVVKLVKTGTSSDPASASCFLAANAAEYWSDGLEISNGKQYLAESLDPTKTTYLFLPNTASFVFGGASLVLGANVELSAKHCQASASTALRFASLVMHGGSYVEYFYSSGVLALNGSLAVAGGEATMCMRNNAEMRINSAITGDGTVRLNTGYPGQLTAGATLATPKSRYSICGDNSAFAGRIVVTSPMPVYLNASDKTAGIAANSDANCAKLWVSSAANLGGVRPAFTYDALRLENYSQLNVTNSITLSEPTMGVCASEIARVNVASGCTLALSGVDVTFDGVLRKEGAGTLALGGAARFADGASAPAAGRNVLKVEGGALKVLSTNCLDGVVSVFSAGTSLVYDAEPAADGMAQFGPVNLREPSGIPFAPAAGASGVAVTIAASGEAPGHGRVALGTFLDVATARAAKDMMRVAPVGDNEVKTSVRANPDGTATIVASWPFSGFAIIFK